MQDVNVNFLDIEAQNLNIHPNSLAYQYLVKKLRLQIEEVKLEDL